MRKHSDKDVSAAAPAAAQPAIPAHMKAASYSRTGDLHVQPDFPMPKCKGRDMLVKVAASSVNPIDIKIRKHGFPPGLRSVYPKVPGLDGAGVVVTASPQSKFKPGDLIYFYVSRFISKWGTAAEYCAVPEESAALLPPSVDIFSAAAIPLVVCTAWQALEKAMPLQGKKIFIQAGSGGVGTMAIQIAKSQGAFVVTTCSSGSSDMCKDLGADVCIDYRSQRFEQVAKEVVPEGYDVVVSMVDGWAYEKHNIQLTKRGGHYCYIFRLATSPKEWAMSQWTKALWLTGRLGSCTVLVAQGNASQGLDQASRLMAGGQLRPVVAEIFPGLEHIAEAHKMLEKGSGVGGKVVVKSVESVDMLMQGFAPPA